MKTIVTSQLPVMALEIDEEGTVAQKSMQLTRQGQLDNTLLDALYQVTLSNNLAQIQREREEAEKMAREELKKKQKTAGNGVTKGKSPDAKPREEEKAVAPPAQPPMLSLFDTPAETEVQAAIRSNSQDAPQGIRNEEEEEECRMSE